MGDIETLEHIINKKKIYKVYAGDWYDLKTEISAEALAQALYDAGWRRQSIGRVPPSPTEADVEPKSEIAREIFAEIKKHKVTMGSPEKIIVFRATPDLKIVEEEITGGVVPLSFIEELEKKYTGGKTDEDISD